MPRKKKEEIDKNKDGTVSEISKVKVETKIVKTVSREEAKDLEELNVFLHDLYCESQDVVVRANIKKWRTLLSQVINRTFKD